MPSTKSTEKEEKFEDLLDGSLDKITILKQDNKKIHETSKPRPIPTQSIKDEENVLQELLLEDHIEDSDYVSDESSYVRPGIQTQVLRKLRRNFWAVQDELDLHGLNKKEAREMVSSFLAETNRRGIRCVRIIHGKGYRSPNNKPVLKTNLFRWLQLRSDVLAYCESAPSDGGSGATLLLLRAKK